MKFVSKLTTEQVKNLKDAMKNSPVSRVRVRAHAVILSDKGYKMDEIADICDVDRDAVSSWIDSWEASGLEGLKDKPRNGRPSILTKEEKETAIKILEENPRSVKSAVEKLKRATGKVVSPKTLKRLAKSAGLVWKRVRKSLKPKRDEKEFERGVKEVEELKKQQVKGEIDLYYFDETGFDLQPAVPSAWQPKGENILVPSSKSKRLNALGFLNVTNNHFESFTFEGSIDSGVVIACFDVFCEKIERKTVVVLDNASVHSSAAFIENIDKWEEKGLFVKYLPAYSPELNLIEIVWRFVKYFWLPFSAYLSFENLVDEVEKVLAGIGSKYIINFS